MELLYIAQQLGMPMKEVAVNWKEIEGDPLTLHKHSQYSLCLTVLNLGYVCHYFSCVVVLVFFISGSKLIPFWSWAQMGRDILFIRLRYLFGIWKLDLPKPKAQ